MQSWRFHDGSFISGFPALDGVAIWVALLTSRAPSSSSQWVVLVSQGEHIHQAVKEGNAGAVRHFLRVDPESLERKDGDRRSLGAEVGNFGEDEWSGDRIHAFHKLGIFLVKSGLVRVPIGRLGSWLCGTTKLLWRHLRVQGRLSFCYPRFVYMNQVPDCRQSYVVTLLVFVFARWCLMVKPSLAQNRLGGPPAEVPIPSNLPHASTCCGTLFFKPVFKPIQKSQALCECFYAHRQATGPTRPRSCTWMLKNKSRISSNCSFQISRVSNQNRLHLCHDRLWFSGDVCILVIQRPQQLDKGFLSSPGHNPSQPLVTVSSLATLPSSPCISLGILLSDGVQCLPCPDLRF